MARDTDVGSRSIGSIWRVPIAGGRTFAGVISEHLRRLKDITNDPRVVEALRLANLPEEEPT